MTASLVEFPKNDLRAKTCTHCGEAKALADFYRRAKAPDGLEWWCKKCKVQTAVESQKRRQEKLNAKARERYAADADLREKRRIAVAEWRKNNKQKVQAQRRRAAESFLKRKQEGDEKTLQMLTERYKRRYQNPSSRAKRISYALSYAAKHPEKVALWRRKSERKAIEEISDLVMADEDWSAMCKSLGENTQRICSPLQ
jgi:hypothetical protein